MHPCSDEELLAHQSPNFFVSLKQGSHTSVFRLVSPIFLRYVEFSRTGTLTVTILIGQFSIATLRPLQLELAYDGAACTDVLMEVVVCDDARRLGFAETPVPVSPHIYVASCPTIRAWSCPVPVCFGLWCSCASLSRC